MTGRVGVTMLNGVGVEARSGRIETPDTQQDLVGHFAVIGLDDAKTVEMVVEPSPDLRDLFGTGKAHLVQDQHVRKPDLAELEVHQGRILGVREDLLRVHHADNAVQPDPIPQIGIVEGHEDPGGIGDAAGFEQDVFDGFRACEQGGDRLDEVVANWQQTHRWPG